MVVRELGDGHAETLGERDPSEPSARLLDVSRRHRDGIVTPRAVVAAAASPGPLGDYKGSGLSLMIE